MLLYSCTVSLAANNFKNYIRTNRDITLYTLDLPTDKKEAVLLFAENNMLPENRNYAYHHFWDNCATRIRDILDMAVDGQFKAEFGQERGRYTFRQHIRRHTWARPFFDWILNFWMGQDIDRPITVWDEMFLPSEIAMRISEFTFSDSGGKARPLVSAVETLNTSQGRPVVLDMPRSLWLGALLVSLLFSELLVLFYLLRGERRGFGVFMGIVNSLLGLFFGIAGSLLFFMTFFTNHDYTYHNSNVLFVNSLFLTAVPLGLLFAFTWYEEKRVACARLLSVIWTYVLFGCFVTMAIKFSPVFFQQNQVTQALLMPLALAMILIMARQ
jgi:hypothetical protein